MSWPPKSSFRTQLQIINHYFIKTTRIRFSKSKIQIVIISTKKHETEGFWQLE